MIFTTKTEGVVIGGKLIIYFAEMQLYDVKKFFDFVVGLCYVEQTQKGLPRLPEN